MRAVLLWSPVSARSCVTKGMGRLLTKAKVGTTNWVMASRKLQQERGRRGRHTACQVRRVECTHQKRGTGWRGQGHGEQGAGAGPPELRHQQRLLKRHGQRLMRHARRRRPLQPRRGAQHRPSFRQSKSRRWRQGAALAHAAVSTSRSRPAQNGAQLAHVEHEEGCLVARGDDQALLQRHLGPQVSRLYPRHTHTHKHGPLRGAQTGRQVGRRWRVAGWLVKWGGRLGGREGAWKRHDMARGRTHTEGPSCYLRPCKLSTPATHTPAACCGTTPTSRRW